MNNKFEYKYSALSQEEKAEVEDIAKAYRQKPLKNEKFERLKQLDKKIKNIPMIVGLSVGITFCLVFGTGLTMILEWNLLIWGIVVMIVGLIPITLNPIIVKNLSKNLTEKYSGEILKLSDEILGE